MKFAYKKIKNMSGESDLFSECHLLVSQGLGVSDCVSCKQYNWKRLIIT